MALALGVTRLDELAERLSSLFAELVAPKERLMDKLRMLPLLEQMSRWMPRNRSGRGALSRGCVDRRGDPAQSPAGVAVLAL